ncbi:MAG: agmatinase [archaeon]|nr:agmatinase [archaeon]
MSYGTSFADAESGYNEADICIYGIPYDRTACFRSGAREGPNAIRRSSYNFEQTHFEHGHNQKKLAVYDYGDCSDQVLPDDMIDEVKFAVGPAIKDGKFTIAMGGDHSGNIPIIQCFKNKSIALISLDAHLDSREEYMGVRNSHACVTRRAAEHLGIDNVFVLGVRSISEEELDAEEIVPYIDAYQIYERGIEWAVKQALDSVKSEYVYVTVDIDCVDPAFAPGTGTPEPFGLHPIDVKKAIDMVGDRLIGFDVMEVCPPADPAGITSILAARYIKEAMAVYGKKLTSTSFTHRATSSKPS